MRSALFKCNININRITLAGEVLGNLPTFPLRKFIAHARQSGGCYNNAHLSYIAVTNHNHTQFVLIDPHLYVLIESARANMDLHQLSQFMVKTVVLTVLVSDLSGI